MWYYYGGDSPDVVNIFGFNNMIPSFGRGGTTLTMMEQLQAGLTTATTQAPFATEDTDDTSTATAPAGNPSNYQAN